MSVRVYLSNATCSSEIRKKQQHVKDILSSLKIEHELVDVLDPRNDEALKFMHANSKAKKANQKPTPPQIFNGEDYCGDYEKFQESIEWDQVYEFLKIENPNKTSKASVVITGEEDEGKEKEDQPENDNKEDITEKEFEKDEGKEKNEKENQEKETNEDIKVEEKKDDPAAAFKSRFKRQVSDEEEGFNFDAVEENKEEEKVEEKKEDDPAAAFKSRFKKPFDDEEEEGFDFNALETKEEEKKEEKKMMILQQLLKADLRNHLMMMKRKDLILILWKKRKRKLLKKKRKKK